MALTFSEGSIGGDIEKVNLAQLEAFYGDPATRVLRPSTTISRTLRLERHRDRTVEHAGSSRAAADQPAHLVLLPLGTADDERRRVWTRTARRRGGSSSSIRASTTHGWMHTTSGVNAVDESVSRPWRRKEAMDTSTATGRKSARFAPSRLGSPCHSGARLAWR